jgi:hypothetical protein
MRSCAGRSRSSGTLNARPTWRYEAAPAVKACLLSQNRTLGQCGLSGTIVPLAGMMRRKTGAVRGKLD